MVRSQLPLNALRAFEASARYLSFTKAAAELHVTPAAVGHQVKVLEDYLGVILFRRLNRALRMTDAGQACLPLLTEGFDRLNDAVKAAKAREKEDVLRVSVAPTLAVKWLVPRLSRLETAHPRINVRVETGLEIADLAKSGYHVGVRFCAGVAPGLRGEKLLDEEVISICAPSLLHGTRPLLQPQDLRYHTLIHLDGETADPSFATWEKWLDLAGVSDVDAHRGPRFSQTITATQAAIEGQGVALVPRLCVLDDLAAGTLVRPFHLGVPSAFAYYVVSPAQSYDLPKVVAFRDWLRSEAAAASEGSEA